MTGNGFSLEVLLRNVHSKKEKREIIAKAVKKGLAVTPEYVEIAIDYFIKPGHYSDVGSCIDIAEKHYGTEKAIQICEESGHMEEAAGLAIKIGQFERAISFYESKGGSYFIPKAIKLAEEKISIDRAIQICENHNWISSAAELARKKGGVDAEIEFCISHECFERAAYLVGKKGDNDEAKRLYDMAIRHYENKDLTDDEAISAAQLALNLGYLDSAILIYERAGIFIQAAELALSKKDRKSAIAYYEKGAKKVNGNYRLEIYLKAAQLTKDEGDYKALIRIIRDAIPACKKLKKYGMAANFAEMKGDFGKARIYRELDRVLN